MNRKAHPAVRIAAGIVLAIPLVILIWRASGPAKLPTYPRWQQEADRIEAGVARAIQDADTRLVRQLLDEKLADREFSFATVATACSGKKVVPLDNRESHRRVKEAIESALAAAITRFNAADSPVRSLRRINEASRHFEDALRESLDAEPDLTCGIPHNRRGELQTSGYPDLRIVHIPSGEVCYLDPKLFEQESAASSLRSFYFEPKDKTLKITDDAVHPLAGIRHDGKQGAWTFTGFHLVDLAALKVRLKAEFQASNKDLYPAP